MLDISRRREFVTYRVVASPHLPVELDPEFGLEQLHPGDAADDAERVLKHRRTVHLDLELVRHTRLPEQGERAWGGGGVS